MKNSFCSDEEGETENSSVPPTSFTNFDSLLSFTPTGYLLLALDSMIGTLGSMVANSFNATSDEPPTQGQSSHEINDEGSGSCPESESQEVEVDAEEEDPYADMPELIDLQEERQKWEEEHLGYEPSLSAEEGDSTCHSEFCTCALQL